MKGRPQKFDEELVLNKAQQVFWEKGYSATSLDEVLAAMGIGSGSFYNSFKGGKKQLYMNVLRQRRDALKEFRANAEASSNPIELIRDFFRGLADADKTTHLRGCLIANTVTEMAFLNDDIENEAVNILKETEQFYTETIKTAQANGQLKNQTDAAVLGRYLITLWNGLNVTRRMYPDNLILKDLIEMQLKIIQ
jgi:TetR/AcrR family transcriptional repressor of nem operon